MKYSGCLHTAANRSPKAVVAVRRHCPSKIRGAALGAVALISSQGRSWAIADDESPKMIAMSGSPVIFPCCTLRMVDYRVISLTPDPPIASKHVVIRQTGRDGFASDGSAPAKDFCPECRKLAQSSSSFLSDRWSEGLLLYNSQYRQCAGVIFALYPSLAPPAHCRIQP